MFLKILWKYGRICNLWEGRKDCDLYLKTVKGNFKAGLIVNRWQMWVITNLLKENV